MKRTWIAALLVLLVILSAMPAAAAYRIWVGAPVANENLEIGVPAMITWNMTGPGGKGETFKIVLMQNNIERGIIAQNLSIPYPGGTLLDGSHWLVGRYVWKAGTLVDGKMAKLGTGYSVKIQTMSNSLSGSLGNFTLSAKPPAPAIEIGKRKPLPGTSITITSPKAGDSIARPTIFNVTWNIQGKMDPNVSVALLYKGVFLATLAASTPNNGTFNWNTNSPTIMDGYYTVRVRTLDRGFEAVSGEFMLSTPPT